MRVEERIARLLKGSSETLSAAESCTGGRISHLLTCVSGSSEYYLGSVTSYAVAVKESVLGVPSSVISSHGVVSAEVACRMASGVRALTGSTWAVSTTGLAEGSDGTYPEGSVWIGVSGPGATKAFFYQCDFGRRGNIRSFAIEALRRLEAEIKEYRLINKT